MNNYLVIATSFGYLAVLFGIAAYAERRNRKKGSSFLTNPYVYALSMAVYCTAWTYYGSVGRAASVGLEFLSIYIGPTLMAPLWWLILRKIIRISKLQRLTTIADFISARYGKSSILGGLITLICVIGIIPYISLQIKAISDSVDILHFGASALSVNQKEFWGDGTFYLTIGLAAFIILFGTRQIETTERHEGLVTAIAFESLIKLMAFLSVGLVVSYVLFNGVGDIFSQIAQHPQFSQSLTVNSSTAITSWFWLCMLSFLAIICLPRQFQVSVVENVNEQHLQKAIWVFPLYLFLINLFVLPIAFAGKLLLDPVIQADSYVLALPQSKGLDLLSLFVYIGGFSAATSMIIVSTIALSTMLSNNLVLPILVGPELVQLFPNTLTKIPIYIRRASIVFVLVGAYLYYKTLAQNHSLVSIGLVSFVAVAQFAPGMIGGIFWKTGNLKGVLTGLLLGFCCWFYTLIVPELVSIGILNDYVLQEGLFHLSIFKPYALLGITDLAPIPHAVFWSLFVNIGAYIIISMTTTQTTLERSQAEIFVDIFKHSTLFESAPVWKGIVSIPDIRSLLVQFLGENRTEQALKSYSGQFQLNSQESQTADGRLVSYAEKLLAGVIGTASARIMVASVVQSEEIKLQDVVDILHETQGVIAINQELKVKTDALQRATEQLHKANRRLKEMDEMKDEFLSTVTHELRTPITSIRALSELLHDNPDLSEDERQHFLATVVRETERISRLISQVLDLERYESNKYVLHIQAFSIGEVIHRTIAPLQPLIQEKNLQLTLDIQENTLVYADEEKLIQVIVNLLSNAIKFANTSIEIQAHTLNGMLNVRVKDDGKGIEKASQQHIFDKFYQAQNQNMRKPQGSGLGLAISKKIIQLHDGAFSVKSEPGLGAVFTFSIPLTPQ